MFSFLFKVLLKFSNFLNFDDCIGIITSKSLRLYPVIIKKRFEVNEKGIISSETMVNYGNYIYDYAHSFFG